MHGPIALLAQTTTTAEPEVPRIVGDPLSWWVFIGAGVALLAFILLAGWYVRSRSSRSAAPR
jgi:uncharacterized protein (DUF58 family)